MATPPRAGAPPTVTGTQQLSVIVALSLCLCLCLCLSLCLSLSVSVSLFLSLPPSLSVSCHPHHPTFLLSAYESKLAGLEPAHPPDSALPCGSTHSTASPRPLQRQGPPSNRGCAPGHAPSPGPSHQHLHPPHQHHQQQRHHSLQTANQSQRFAMPRPLLCGPEDGFQSDQR